MADFGADPALVASQSNPQAVSTKGFDPGEGECRDCRGELPMYGVAPHECYWRKGPEFVIGQSTLVPFDESACFVPDLEPHETWADFYYPQGCGIYYCSTCQRDKYGAEWARLTARIGEPPAEVASCNHGNAQGNAQTQSSTPDNKDKQDG